MVVAPERRWATQRPWQVVVVVVAVALAKRREQQDTAAAVVVERQRPEAALAKRRELHDTAAVVVERRQRTVVERRERTVVVTAKRLGIEIRPRSANRKGRRWVPPIKVESVGPNKVKNVDKGVVGLHQGQAMEEAVAQKQRVVRTRAVRTRDNDGDRKDDKEALL